MQSKCDNTSDSFATRLSLMVDHHKPECHIKQIGLQSSR